MPKKNAKGPPLWFELFDTGEMDTVCEMVRSDIQAATLGAAPALHYSLRGILLDRLSRYMADHYRASPDARAQALNNGALTQADQSESYRAAERLHAVVERLADDFEDRYPFDAGAADARAFVLRFAWLEFIAYGSAYLVYWEKLKAWNQRTRVSKKPRGRAKGVTAEDLAKQILAAGKAGLTDHWADVIAAEYGISKRTVYQRQDEARALGLLQLAAVAAVPGSDTED